MTDNNEITLIYDGRTYTIIHEEDLSCYVVMIKEDMACARASTRREAVRLAREDAAIRKSKNASLAEDPIHYSWYDAASATFEVSDVFFSLRGYGSTLEEAVAMHNEAVAEHRKQELKTYTE